VQVSEGQVKASSVELAPIVSDTSTDGSVAAAAAEIIDLTEQAQELTTRSATDASDDRNRLR
jgi:hypothetical protein